MNHVALIMDANGRWAKERGRKRFWGHVRGAKVVSQIAEEAYNCGIKALTFYAFSTENWGRPLLEINVLVKLFNKFLNVERKNLIAKKFKFKVIGNTDSLSKDLKKLIKDIEEETKDFNGLKFTIAFGYGGRNEIVDSVNSFIKQNPGKCIDENSLGRELYNPESGDVDLLIRTGGDQRISNFLLWQTAYAELYFTLTKWPDFSRDEFRNILAKVSLRERRFGQVESTENSTKSKNMACNDNEGYVLNSSFFNFPEEEKVDSLSVRFDKLESSNVLGLKNK